MALKKWAYVFLSPGFEPRKHSVTLSSEDCEVSVIGIGMADKAAVIDVAKQLVEENVQMIELCGGFGPIWIARVTEAIQEAVPVGSVAYGPECRASLLKILSPA